MASSTMEAICNRAWNKKIEKINFTLFTYNCSSKKVFTPTSIIYFRGYGKFYKENMRVADEVSSGRQKWYLDALYSSY